MFEQTFKNIDDILHKDAGCGSTTYDLSAKNPNKKNETELRDSQEVLDEISSIDAESLEIVSVIRGLL